MQKLSQCPDSGLILPTNLIDEKQALKKVIDKMVEDATSELGHYKGNYFLTIQGKFDKFDPSSFNMSIPKATKKIPSFKANSLVFWISPRRGIRELLWMVAPKKKGEKLQVEFNHTGIAYLQAKDAMPKAT
jgi:hypothetical protein